MLIDFDLGHRTVKAIQVGRFVVFVCCGEDKHVVFHGPTKQPLMCGLTHRVAMMIADTMSLYTDDTREVRCLPDVMKAWAEHLMRNPKKPRTYAAFHKTWTGERARLPVLSPEVVAEFQEAIGRQ